MTQEEIIEYNKRCAEFLGWKYVKDGDVWNPDMSHDYSFVYSQNLKFHSDWNWIMEVIKAIIKIPNNDSPDTTLQTRKRDVQYILMSTEKEAVVEAINQFLIWYEKNK